MRRTSTGFFTAIALSIITFGAIAPASAGKLDLAIGRFINCASPAHCSADIKGYERFMTEYAFGLTPKIMAPAETLGYSGFFMGLEGTLTPIPDAGGNDRWQTGTSALGRSPASMFVPALHVRKGLPWSFEIGGAVNYLAQSELVAIQGDIKWSLFEGYKKGFRGALPDVAVRGAVSRILGETDLDMTIISVDGSVSYPFAIGGMLTLTPYVGLQYIWTLIRTEPMIYRDDARDFTSNDESLYLPPEGTDWNMGDLSGPNLKRTRFFLGLIFRYEMLSITMEAGWGLAKKWNTAVNKDPDAYEAPATLDEDQLEASVNTQFQITFGAGLDF